MHIVPISFRAACAFIREHHRHHVPPPGHKFSVGVSSSKGLVGVLVAGRPMSRHLDDGFTLEFTRCCTDGTENACSMLYGAARRIAKAMGFRRVLTYTLARELGTSLKASGWTQTAEVPGRTWSRPSD